MAIERVAFDWAGGWAARARLGPAERVARWLADRPHPPGELDLSRVLLVAPGGRAGRLIVAALAVVGDELDVAVSPPMVLTPGGLCRALVERCGALDPSPAQRSQSPASPTAARLAWITALRGLPEHQRAALLPRAPASEDHRAWSAIAQMLNATAAELARAGFGVQEAMLEVAADPSSPDHERWCAIVAATDAYVRTLNQWGLRDPALSDLDALRCIGSRRSDGSQPPAIEVVLAGVTELDGLARRALHLPGVCTHALVFAESTALEEPDLFDEFGCPTLAWRDRGGVLHDQQVVFENAPGDQAGAVFGAIASVLDGHTGRESDERTLAPDDVAVVCVDDTLIPSVEREGVRVGVPVRPASGRDVRLGRFGALLEASAAFLREGTFSAFAAFCRHPDAGRAIVASELAGAGAEPGSWRATLGAWLGAMDRYAVDRLPGKVDGSWRASDTRTRDVLERMHAGVGRVLGGLGCPGVDTDTLTRPACAWMPELIAMLGRVCPAAEDLSAFDIASGECVRAAINEVGELHPDATGNVPAWEAIALVTQAIGRAADPEAARERVELIGWLEALFEPAGVLIFVGMDDAHVPGRGPASGAGGALLPDAVRARLGLPTGAARAARDAFLFETVCNGRDGSSQDWPSGVRAICGRRDESGNPLWPSRLLLQSDDDGLVARVRRFTGATPEHAPLVRAVSAERAHVSERRFEALPREAWPEVRSMSVTSFKTFLASPYAFYAQQMQGLREAEEPGRELDGRGLGILIHEVLDRWARSSAVDAEDEDEIAACVLDELERVSVSWYGSRPSVPVRVQVRDASRRLLGFASWQAERARAGWRVVASEWDAARTPDAGEPALPMPEGEAAMALRGRIDRIDRHQTRGDWAVLDYKTGSDNNGRTESPTKTHRKGRGDSARWVDLQLPLYRHLIRPWLERETGAVFDVDRLTLAYIGLPSSAQVEDRVGGWGPEELASADATAQAVVRAVRAGRVIEEGDEPPREGVLGALCGYGGPSVRVRTGENA